MAEERPRFRRDLVAKPIESEGISYVEAVDPRTGSAFLFYAVEHAVAEVFDGRPIPDVVPGASERSGIELTVEQLAAFAHRLTELGFLESGHEENGHDASAPLPALEAAPAPPLEAALAPPLEAALAPPTAEPVPAEPPAAATPPSSGEPVEDEPEPAHIFEVPTRSGASLEAALASAASEAEAPTIPETAAPAAAPEPNGSSARPAEVSGELQTAARLPEGPPAVETAPPPSATAARVPSGPSPSSTVTHEGPAFKPTLADLTDADHGPPPIGTPQRPLTEETAMPPLLPPMATAAGEAAAPPRQSGRLIDHPLRTPAPQPVGARPRAKWPADRTSGSVPTIGTSGEPPAEREPPPLALVPAPAAAPAPAAPASTGGSLPEDTIAEPAPTAPQRKRLPAIFYAGLGLATAVIVAVVVYQLSSRPEAKVPTVRTVVPTAGSLYRWFDAVGTVKPGGERMLTFPSAGKVAKVMAAGTAFHPGDVIAELEGARKYKGDLSHNHDRLAHYEQLLETTRAENNRPEARQAEIKIAEKKRLIAEAEAGLAHEAIIASSSGEIAETLVTVGATVTAGATAARTKGTDWRAELELSRDDAEHLRHLGFCRAEIDGKPLDCSLSPDGGDETHVGVDLPVDPAVVAGRPVRVARARYDGVFVLPATALVPSNGLDRRVFVVKEGRAESDAVVLVDQTPTEIVVSQGLEPGSAVVIDVPPQLRSRAPVHAVEVKPRAP